MDRENNIINSENNKMPVIDFIIINIPIWLFFIFSISVLMLGLSFNSFIKYILFGVSWWAFCGGILVSTDFKRKSKLYTKILKQAKSEERLKRLTGNLKDTICNFTLSLAIYHRKKKNR